MLTKYRHRLENRHIGSSERYTPKSPNQNDDIHDSNSVVSERCSNQECRSENIQTFASYSLCHMVYIKITNHQNYYFTERRTRRSWRPRPDDCRRKRYIVDFKDNPVRVSIRKT